METIRILLGKARYVFVITQSLRPSGSGSGACSARYVQPIVEWQRNDFLVWIGTSASSRKIAEIRANPEISLALGNDSAGANLIIHGKATLYSDVETKKKYWKPEWLLFFPDGAEARDYIVVKVFPESIELMDLKRNVTPHPFGLKPLQLVRRDSGWQALES